MTPSARDWKVVARNIFAETLAAIDICATLARKLSRQGSLIHVGNAAIDLSAYRRIVAVALGKAAFAMAVGLEHALAPDFHPEGFLVVPAPPPRPLPGWKTIVAGHPLPTAESFAAGRAILSCLEQCDSCTVVFFLLSGGGSSLVELPLEPQVSLEDFQQLHRVLVTCGAGVGDINAVRKHLSATKGGRMAVAAARAMRITLGVSDVPAGQESALASGPTLPDPTTVRDAERVAKEYRLAEKLPPSLLEKFERHTLVETPKPGDPAFERTHFHLLLGVRDLLHHAHRIAEASSCVTICDNSTDNWRVEQSADFLLGQLAALRKAHPGRPVAVIADGELSSPVAGKGLGGRNAAFVLACVEKIAGQPITVLSAGTDGVDGNSPAAGAVADGETLARARVAGLDPRDFSRRSDSYTFHKRLGDAIETGPTGNNLRDLRVVLGY